MKILIVDDHRYIVDQLMDDLKNLLPDAECVGTTKPYEVLKLFEKYRFDIVFMGIEMRGANGIKLAKKIQEIQSRTNIIYISGVKNYAVECFKTFPSAFLEKPIELDELRSALNNLRYPISNITDEMIQQEYTGKALIGKKIQKMSEECGMTRKEFGDAMEVANQTIYRWENGERSPDIVTFLRIMKVFGVDLDKLL